MSKLIPGTGEVFDPSNRKNHSYAQKYELKSKYCVNSPMKPLTRPFHQGPRKCFFVSLAASKNLIRQYFMFMNSCKQKTIFIILSNTRRRRRTSMGLGVVHERLPS